MKILISGGGIAGMTVANYLRRQGHTPVVLEKAAAFSNVGFVLSLKSFGVEIMRELGLEAGLRARATRSNYINFFTAAGKLVRRLDFETINQNLADSIMAPRASIHDVLYQAIKDKVEVRFATTITSLALDNEKVSVRLSDESSITADMLIIAEGIRSTTRSIVWQDSPVEDLNIFYAAARIPGKHAYSKGEYHSYRGVKKIFAILPLSEDELALQCNFHQSVTGNNIETVSKGMLGEIFSDLPSAVVSLITDAESNQNIYFDKIAMVHESVLYKGRIVMLGDAGYCPTPLSGMGASLGIFGAKALTHFLSDSAGRLPTAFERYNTLMQPIIQKFQTNARANAKTFLPMSKRALRLNDLIMKLVPSAIISRKIGNELTLTKNERELR